MTAPFKKYGELIRNFAYLQRKKTSAPSRPPSRNPFCRRYFHRCALFPPQKIAPTVNKSSPHWQNLKESDCIPFPADSWGKNTIQVNAF